MEEGEIVHNSTGKAVAESCKSLMVEILTWMHSSACIPHLIPGQAPPKAPPTGQGQSRKGVMGVVLSWPLVYSVALSSDVDGCWTSLDKAPPTLLGKR